MLSSKTYTIPLNIKELNDNSFELYVIDYQNSSLKGEDFFKYLEKTALLADIDTSNVSEDEILNLLDIYMNSQYFHHFLSFNIAVLNCIYKIKNYPARLQGSCLTTKGEDKFIKTHKELLQKWISFFDSYLIYMIIMASNKDMILKERYPENMIKYDKSVCSTAVSLFLDPFFYDYFQSGINENEVYYWTYQYDNKLYDGKHFNNIILNKSNWIFKVLHNTSTDSKWNTFLEKCFK